MSIVDLKRAAGHRAADLISDGMVVGLGSGTTAYYATLRVAQRLREGGLRGIVAIPTSEETAELARREGIPLTTFGTHRQIDVTLDGADEVDPKLNVIKGRRGFLLREKIVAAATKKVVIVIDESKLVARLGSESPVPVEVVRFGWQRTMDAIADTGASASLRLDGDEPFSTDEGNFIIDCEYDDIPCPQELSECLNAIPGVVENGLFVNLVHAVVVASPSGVRILEG